MRIAALVLLAVGVGGTVLRPRRLPPWALPVIAAGVSLAVGTASLAETRREMGTLAGPLGFLLAAVPLAVLLDRLGFFESVAGLLSPGPRLVPGLWIMAAVVTTVLNLDASVVLLTPLYVRVARRAGLSARSLGFQPVLLALLASSALPVSNLTNLIASAHTGTGPASFLAHLGPPSLVATVGGYWLYRRAMPVGERAIPASIPVEREALVKGGVVLGLVLAGFVGGPAVGIQPWEVAVGADVVLVAMARSVPLRPIPWGTALVAASLAVLSVAAAPYLPIEHLVSSGTPAGMVRTIAESAGLGNLLNNLPGLLIVLPAVPHGSTWQLWALLLGLNVGPMLLVTGTLASMLWVASMGALGVPVGKREYARAGWRIGLPCLLAAGAVLVAMRALWGG